MKHLFFVMVEIGSATCEGVARQIAEETGLSKSTDRPRLDPKLAPEPHESLPARVM